MVLAFNVLGPTNYSYCMIICTATALQNVPPHSLTHHTHKHPSHQFIDSHLTHPLPSHPLTHPSHPPLTTSDTEDQSVPYTLLIKPHRGLRLTSWVVFNGKPVLIWIVESAWLMLYHKLSVAVIEEPEKQTMFTFLFLRFIVAALQFTDLHFNQDCLVVIMMATCHTSLPNT